MWSRGGTHEDLGSGAAVALRVIAAVDDGELGMLVGELCAGLAAGARLPGWVEYVGQAEIVAAAVMREEISRGQ